MSDDILRLIHEKVEKLDSKIDTISSDIVEIKITSARHDENLKLHMKRSDLAEQGINILKEELVPIKKHVHGIDSIIKFIMIGSSFIGAIAGILKLFKKI
jgi:archaellum component FlaC